MSSILIHCFTSQIKQTILDLSKTQLLLNIKTYINLPDTINIYRGDNTFIADQFVSQFDTNNECKIFYPFDHSKYRSIPTVRISNTINNIGSVPQFTPGYPGVGNATASSMAIYYNFPSYIPTAIIPKIGILSFGGNYQTSDLNSFWILNNNPTPYPTVITTPVPSNYIPPTFGTDPTFDSENTLDIENSGGVCTNAQITWYSTDNSIDNYYPVIQQAILDGMNFLSISYALTESGFNSSDPTIMPAINSILKTASEGGMVILAAAGDSGCYAGGDSGVFQVNYPSTSPYVISCGGTSLVQSTETAWGGIGIPEGGGGGQSAFPSINFLPSYQSHLNVPNPIYPSALSRFTPDIAMNADGGSPWTIFFNGHNINSDGTSAVTPFMAGYLATLYGMSQPGSLPNLGYAPLGINNFLYQVNYSTCFNDITMGNNGSTQTEALVGYDMSTGLGSIQGTNLANALQNFTCVAYGTKILMKDGNTKEIQDIKPGDKVASDLSWKKHTVVKVLRQEVLPDSLVDFLEFSPNSLGENIPINPLKITSYHPIFIDGKHVYAKIYKSSPGVKKFTDKVKEYLQPENGRYYLYDLEFETHGCYIAEGVCIQSRSPRF